MINDSNVKMKSDLTIKRADRPKGYDGKYLFLKDAQSKGWKAKIEMRENGTSSAVTISVSPVDSEGKAERRNGAPMVGDPITHAFKESELLAPNFDLEERIFSLAEDRIAAASAQLAFKSDLATITKKLTKG